MKTIRLLLGGFGAANKPMLKLFAQRSEQYRNEYGFELLIVGISDSAGCAISKAGLSFDDVLKAKNESGSVSNMIRFGNPGMTTKEMIESCDAEIYVDAQPPFLPDALPGTECIKNALLSGKHVVTANKGPLATHWEDTVELAKQLNLQIRYGSAASSSLHILESGKFLAETGELLSFEGMFNASCMYILDMMQQGKPYSQAIAEAKNIGILDPDPSTDIDGWDSAEKLVIHTNTYFGTCCHLNDVIRKGISTITPEDIKNADSADERWCVVSSAEKKENGEFELRVEPKRYRCDSIIGRTKWNDKMVIFHTKTQGDQVHYCLDCADGTAGGTVMDIIKIARSL